MNSKCSSKNSPRSASSPNLSEEKEYRYTRKERKELCEITRSLRRVKRQLLLKEAEQPQNQVDNLRDLLIRVASTENVYDGDRSTSDMWASSSSLKESDIPTPYHLNRRHTPEDSSSSFSSLNESIRSLHFDESSTSMRSLDTINEKKGT
jgi:hypothetical protein